MIEHNEEPLRSEPTSKSVQGSIIRPRDIITPRDYFEYARQRIGEKAATMPTTRVPSPTLLAVMKLVLGLLKENEAAYNELQIFEIEGGDYVFTSDFDTADAGDGASEFFLRHAVSQDQKAFASGYANTVKKLHVLHRSWCEAGKPIRPKNQE